MSKKTFSPTLFLICEFFILIPSILFVLGLILDILFQNNTLMLLVVPSGAVLQNIFVTIITPFAGGFLAYQYLERYKPKGLVSQLSKGIIFYSLVLVGLVITYLFFENVL